MVSADFVTAVYARDAAAAGAILAFFATAWYGWALEAPPTTWRSWIFTGLAASWAGVALGVAVTWINWNTGTVFDSSTSPIFGLIVGIEFSVSAIGAWILKRRSQEELIPPWIALVVGVHFVPLAYILGIPVLYLLAALISVLAVVSFVVARANALTTSSVTGVMIGSGLLGGAVMSLATVAFM
jgi:hypothetical protein